MSRHRAGVNLGFLTKHRLKLLGLTASKAEKIQSEIDAMACVDGVWIDMDKSAIKIAYDASHHNIDDMIEIIRKQDADVRADGWRGLKLRMYRQTDQNIKDNAAHEAHCCNKLPTRRR